MGRVVVGIDSSAGSAEAVAFAFDEAQARCAELRAIYVWESKGHERLGWTLQYHSAGHAAAADRMLREATCGWEDKYADVSVSREAVFSDNPVRGLNNTTGGADLIVVGARGSGGFDTLALGSVSDGLVRSPPCRVAIVAAAQRTSLSRQAHPAARAGRNRHDGRGELSAVSAPRALARTTRSSRDPDVPMPWVVGVLWPCRPAGSKGTLSACPRSVA